MLTAADLVRRFGGRTAVDSVSFEVRRGEVFGLLGPNGAGKTTTLRMLGALIQPTSGQVRINGTPVERGTAGALRRRVGFLTENPGLWDQLTVGDNLRIYGRLFGIPDPAATADRELRAFDLYDRRDDRAGLLSKGMKQKLALARTLLHDPEIVLLDEPTANLDPVAARAVRDRLLELRGRGRAIVVSTHNLDEVERLADRVGLIRTRLVAVGPPDQLRRQLFGHRLRIRLAAPLDKMTVAMLLTARGATDVRVDGLSISLQLQDPDCGVPDVVAALVGAGARVREVTDESQPMEEVYMRLLDGARP